MFGSFALVDVRGFGRQDVAPAFEDFDTALPAAATAAAGRGHEDLGIAQYIE